MVVSEGVCIYFLPLEEVLHGYLLTDCKLHTDDIPSKCYSPDRKSIHLLSSRPQQDP
ncbi:TPA: hypothetical protein O3H02_004306 [Salmonella enterica subsp. enterica serovar Saintpaul str. CFSAN004144]|nr:hypothetical protein [Salmonella enterica subsp. enterica serovar Saintpaul str. CFSAN004144]